MKSKHIFIIVFIFLGISTYAQVFNDKPANETVGEMPSKWQLIDGAAEIATFEGVQVISLNHKSVIAPQIAGDSYLTDDFTLKFEAYFDELEKAIYYYQYYEIRFWEGTGNVIVPSNSGNGFYAPIKIQRNGVLLNGREGSSTKILDQNYERQLENKEGAWRTIIIKYTQGTLTFTIDGIEILNHENFMYAPQMVSIGARYNSDKTGFIRGIKNISITGITMNNEEEENDDDDTDDTDETDETDGTDGDGDGGDGGDGGDENNDDDDTGNNETSKYSGLEALDEGNGIGWRLKGREPEFYKNIGSNAVDFSYSEGTSAYDLGASGEWSFAMGNMVYALGDYSLAMGSVSFAKGEYSLAFGSAARASGRGSIAFGIGSRSLKDHAIAIGNEITANGLGAIALGIETSALKDNATAIGYKATANGISAIAMGEETSATGDHSFAVGKSNLASGIHSVAFGFNSEAKGFSALAMGEKTIASGKYATSFGLESMASGILSTSSGYRTNATGYNSIAFGDQANASGKFSTTIGSLSNATGDYSIALGHSTKAESYNSTVLGMYNIGGGDPLNWKAKDPLFEIGNGNYTISSGTRFSNALTILKNGNTGIGTHQPWVKLHIEGGADASLNTGGYMILGDKQGENLVFDNNEMMARNNVQPSTLYLQNNGGDVFVGGSLVHSSDKRLKTNITELRYGLNTILKLNPVSYNWKKQPEQIQQSLGLIAQEVQPLIEEIVKVGTDKDQTLSLSYTELIPVLIKAMQEQQDLINDQDKQIKGLSAQLNQFKNLDDRIKLIEASNNK